MTDRVKFKNLEVPISIEDRIRAADRIRVVENEIESAKEELSQKKSETDTRVKELEQNRKELLKKVATGKEFRDVQVIERINEDRKVVEIVSKETGEVVDERSITEADRQGRLGFDDVDGTLREEEDPLEKMTAGDIRKHLKEDYGVKPPSKASRGDLVALVLTARKEDEQLLANNPPRECVLCEMPIKSDEREDAVHEIDRESASVAWKHLDCVEASVSDDEGEEEGESE